MDDILREIQLVHETGFYLGIPSLDESWQQVTKRKKWI